MKKIFSLFAALTLSVGLWAAAPANVESVDLGLPSGLKWATFNVGATAPEGNGDYFAWGETSTKTTYDWSTYFDTNDDGSTFTKYNLTGGLTTLEPEDDAATANWGSDWRMPTKAEQDELRAECTWTWTEDYNGTGIKGYVITSKAEGNTNSIFLPASGCRDGSSLDDVGTYGYYWSSSLNEHSSREADYLDFGSDNVGWYYNDRYYGQSVRAVTTKSIAPAPVEGDQFVDATSGLKFQVTAVGEANTVKVIKNNYTGTSYTIPATVKYNDVDFAVTKIETSTFKECSSLLSVTLPEGLLTIGNYAFQECSSLQSVTIPASVTTIGAYAFKDCSSLQSVTLSEGLLTIVDGAFYGCSSLQSITIPAGVTTIGANAFCECTGLTSVTFLGNACQNNIGDMAFYNVGKDASALLTLPNSWTGTLPDEDGRWYDGQFKLTAPAPVEGDQFVDATSGLKLEVTAVGAANTVKVIKNNYSGTSYTVPATVSYNGVDFAVTEIGTRAFDNCESLQSITIPDGVITIGTYAFEGCESLQTITIPAGVTEIQMGAFAGSGLQTITIPAGVTEIGTGAFYECTGLTSVTFLGNACQDAIGGHAFEGVGDPDPALLTLPNSWTGTLPDEDGNWYGGKFELSEEPSGWVNVNVNADVNKYLYNGQMIIRKGDKLYNTVGAEL